MSLPLIRKPFVMQGLAFTSAALIMNNANAEQERIQRLHAKLEQTLNRLKRNVLRLKQKVDTPQMINQSAIFHHHI